MGHASTQVTRRYGVQTPGALGGRRRKLSREQAWLGGDGGVFRRTGQSLDTGHNRSP
jgi:hypothetical protein